MIRHVLRCRLSGSPGPRFQSGKVAGKRWALLPSAAGVIDPLLSTGFPLTLLGVQRLARLLHSLDRPEFEPGLVDYADTTTREFEATARLVKALYARMGQFDDFKQLSLLYFTAASFSEAARRLGKNSLVPDFLLCGDPVFGPPPEGIVPRGQAAPTWRRGCARRSRPTTSRVSPTRAAIPGIRRPRRTCTGMPENWTRPMQRLVQCWPGAG